MNAPQVILTPRVAFLALSNWRHKENRKVYHITGECLVKNPDTKEWTEHILYAPVVGPQYSFARTSANFLERFEQVDK